MFIDNTAPKHLQIKPEHNMHVPQQKEFIQSYYPPKVEKAIARIKSLCPQILPGIFWLVDSGKGRWYNYDKAEIRLKKFKGLKHIKQIKSALKSFVNITRQDKKQKRCYKVQGALDCTIVKAGVRSFQGEQDSY